ncbi:hypothetical protein [Larkinella rosea]|uniref:DUF4595 domain-containing protein n=1 Tax=Larkinella rosea TaxID=2025312 RepID=A0A3P1BN62_9BACT|nr:hypothetical protein [Larkinella rosea]RRB02353.1 hypothetical protein EHT25_17945 [Larkinella rosea]
MKKWFSFGGLAVLLVACTLNDPTPSDQVCLVTEMTRFQQKSTGLQEISRQSFAYERGQLTYYQDQTPDQSTAFYFRYIGGKVATAYTADNSTVLSLEYDKYERIEKASFLINDKEQTVFSLFYASENRSVRLIRVVETRVMLPTNSFIASRTFQFSYQEIAGNTQDIVSQTVQNGYKDGSRTEEEFTFEQDAQNHSPYYDTNQAIVLTLLALTNHSESNAAQYLQRYDSKSVTHEIVSTNGTTSRRELTQFTTDFDSNFNPVRSTQHTRITIPGDSFPKDEYYQQTLKYNCIE